MIFIKEYAHRLRIHIQRRWFFHVEKAVDLCNLILEDDPENVYTLKLKQECEEKLAKDEKRNAEIAMKVLERYDEK